MICDKISCGKTATKKPTLILKAHEGVSKDESATMPLNVIVCDVCAVAA